MNRFGAASAILALGVASAAIAAQAAGGAALQIGARADLTRLSFRFEGATTVQVRADGPWSVLRFSRAAEIDIVRLRIDPPQFVETAEIRSAEGRPLEIALKLKDGARLKHFAEGERVVVDLTAAEAEAPAAQKEANGADPIPKGGVVKVEVIDDPAAARFTFRWAAPLKAAVFKRDEAVWIVFDAPAKLDLAGAPLRGRTYSDVQVLTGSGYSGLRISAQSQTQATAEAKGGVWTVTLSARAAGRTAAVAARREAGPEGGGRLAADFGRPGVVRWIEDPAVGDRIGVAMVDGPVLGIAGLRATLEAALPPTAHGALIEPRADDIEAEFVDGDLIVARGDGLIASYRPSADGAAALEPSLGSYGALNLENWADTGDGPVLEQLDKLQAAAAAEGFSPGAPSTARLTLARALLAKDLAPEALGALKAAAVNQPHLEIDPDYRLMRAAANVMLGRIADAERDLSASTLARDPTAALWRGYAAGLKQDWITARRNLEAGRDALSGQTRTWRTAQLAMLGEAALELGDLAAADAAIASAASDAQTQPQRLRAALLRARLDLAQERNEEALKQLTALSAAPDEAVAVRATLERVRVERALDRITPAQAVDALEALRFRWRGDALELETIRLLGRTYVELGKWREGLRVMQSASIAFADQPSARAMRVDMTEIFQRLFLEGEADQLEPIRALGLFYEFKDLTPFGPAGDRLIRRLAGRLVQLDLLEQAAELLQHQVDNRLEGAAKAQIALDLAGVYLADGKPEKALQALAQSRQPALPTQLVADRRLMEASALMALQRYDHAVELVEKDKSADAARLRAEVAWRRRDWAEAHSRLQALLPAAGSQPLEKAEQELVLRAAVAAVLAKQTAPLGPMYRAYGARMGTGPAADAFEVVASDADVSGSGLRDAARIIARSDLMDRFLAGVKATMTAPAAEPAAKTG